MDAHRLLTAARERYAAQDYAHALSLAQQAALLPQVEVEARALAVNAALQVGDFASAIAGLEFLLARYPDHAQFRRLLAMTHNNRGSRSFHAGDLVAADQDFRAALRLDANHLLALFNSARLAVALADLTSARATLRRLLELSPNDLGARVLQAEAELAAGDSQASQASIEGLAAETMPSELRMRVAKLAAQLGDAARALALLATETDPMAHIGLGIELGETLLLGNRRTEASSAYQSAARAAEHGLRSPGWRAVLAEALALPSVYADPADLAAARQRVDEGLTRLLEDSTPSVLQSLEPKLEQLIWSNFFLAYQGENDLDFQSRYGELLDRAVRTIAPQFCTPSVTRRRPGPPRVGFLSSSFRECTAGAYFSAWIGTLTAAGMETSVFQLGPRYDEWTDRIGATANALYKLSTPLIDVAETVRDAELDLLIYPELGMDARLLPLAALRLAGRQAMAWGHPVTSGLPSIDAYFSCAAMEPRNAGQFYRERLLALPGLGTHYRRPPPVLARSRSELGLPERARLVLVAQAPFKIHPDNDALFAALAAADSQVVLLLFAGETLGMTSALRARLDRALRATGADPERQIRVLPLTSRQRFLEIIRVCDLMLDTLHWSGGNTSLDALHVGLPIVTCRGKYMRGRQTAAMLDALGLPDCVAATPDALQQLALTCIADSDRRQHMHTTIVAGGDALFEGDRALAALQAEVHALIASPSA